MIQHLKRITVGHVPHMHFSGSRTTGDAAAGIGERKMDAVGSPRQRHEFEQPRCLGLFARGSHRV